MYNDSYTHINSAVLSHSHYGASGRL